jgi:hypothetical protein
MDANLTPEVKRRSQIKAMLKDSKLIAMSPYDVSKWEKIVDVIPMNFLDELYGFLMLEQGKK